MQPKVRHLAANRSDWNLVRTVGSIWVADLALFVEVLPLRSTWIFALWLSAAALFAFPLNAEESTPAVRGVERVNISTGGIGIYRPGKWGALRVSLRNPQDREVHLLATTHFKDDPTLQFGRRIWMPPHSRTVVWHPIQMPRLGNPDGPGASGVVSLDDKFFDVESQVMSTAGGVETLAISENGALHFDQSIRVSSDTPTVAVIQPPQIEPSRPGAKWANPMDLLLTVRFERGQSRNIVVLPDEQLPACEEVLGTLDQMLIADDRITENLAAISAIRRWVTSGGRLWVMADRVRPELLQALLGDDQSLAIAGTTELTSVDVTATAYYPGVAHFQREMDRPVKMVRMMGKGFQPAFMCDGWPAAFWKEYGAGRILITTLGTDGWLRMRTPQDLYPEGGFNFSTPFFPSDPLNSLSVDFCTRRPETVMPAAVADDAVQSLIGYRVPARNLVISGLLTFTALIGGGVLLFSRRQRLEWMGIAIPVASLLIAGLLMIIGIRSRSQISNPTAAVQVVQPISGTNDVRISGSAGYFIRGDGDVALVRGSSGGFAVPEMTGLTGSTRRLIWKDLDQWEWEKLTLSPGLRVLNFQAATQQATQIRTEANYVAGQLTGHLELPPGVIASDAILATNSGRIGLSIDETGHWKVSQELLASDQFVAGTVLSDQQQQRNEILSQLLAPMPGQLNPPIATLYAWTKPWESALAMGDQAPTGSALLAVPIEWSAMKPGTSVTLPRALLTFREVTGPDGSRPIGFYDARSRQWVEKTGAGNGWIAFDIPTDLLPLKTRKVELTIKVLGPVGRLELSTFRNGQREVFQTWLDPVGTLTHTVEDGQLLPIDESGRLLFHVSAGHAIDAESATEREIDEETKKSLGKVLTYWQFEDISARITAEVPSQPTASVAP